MKSTLAIVVLSVAAWMSPARAVADVVASPASPVAPSTGTTTNVTTIAASKVLSPGSYTASIVPSYNSGMARRFEKTVARIPGLTAVSAQAEDSSLHFTVKNGAVVQVADIQKAVVKANASAVMSEPILENSLKASTGL